MNLESTKTQLAILFIVALAPIITLLVRGIVWGADSFAYMAVSCGQGGTEAILGIHSPQWFVWFIQNVIACNFYVLLLFNFLAYLAILLSIWQIGKRYFAHQAWRLPVYVGCLTPLFFLEVLRFEHELAGIAFSFVTVVLFLHYLSNSEENKHNFTNKVYLLVFAIYLGYIAYLLWSPSVLILFLGFFFLKIPEIYKKIGLIVGVGVFLFFEWHYLLGSFNFEAIVTEELPVVGLIFVVHILEFYKRIPGTLKWYTLFLVAFGALKSKYMFLAAPLLLIGLLDKQLKEGIVLKKRLFGIKEIPVLYICGILLVGWMIAGTSLHPTGTDISEMQSAIMLASDKNVILYNSWDDGWAFISLGYDTNYKISPPEPDWNNLTRPFIAYTNQKLDCNKIGKKTFSC